MLLQLNTVYSGLVKPFLSKTIKKHPVIAGMKLDELSLFVSGGWLTARGTRGKAYISRSRWKE